MVLGSKRMHVQRVLVNELVTLPTARHHLHAAEVKAFPR